MASNDSPITQPIPSASTTAAAASDPININSTSSSSNILNLTLGFCHSCNRQTRINVDSFSCSVCSSGFVELVDPVVEFDSLEHLSNEQQRTAAPASAAASTAANERTRLFNPFLNYPMFRPNLTEFRPTPTATTTTSSSGSAMIVDDDDSDSDSDEQQRRRRRRRYGHDDNDEDEEEEEDDPFSFIIRRYGFGARSGSHHHRPAPRNDPAETNRYNTRYARRNSNPPSTDPDPLPSTMESTTTRSGGSTRRTRRSNNNSSARMGISPYPFANLFSMRASDAANSTTTSTSESSSTNQRSPHTSFFSQFLANRDAAAPATSSSSSSSSSSAATATSSSTTTTTPGASQNERRGAPFEHIHFNIFDDNVAFLETHGSIFITTVKDYSSSFPLLIRSLFSKSLLWN